MSNRVKGYTKGESYGESKEKTLESGGEAVAQKCRLLQQRARNKNFPQWSRSREVQAIFLHLGDMIISLNVFLNLLVEC